MRIMGHLDGSRCCSDNDPGGGEKAQIIIQIVLIALEKGTHVVQNLQSLLILLLLMNQDNFYIIQRVISEVFNLI